MRQCSATSTKTTKGTQMNGGIVSETGGVPGVPSTGGSGVPTSGAPGGAGVPGSVAAAPEGSAATSASPGLTPGEMSVLRKIAADGDFRLKFAQDPIAAITDAGLHVTTSDYEKLERFSAAQLQQVADGIAMLTGAIGSSGLRAEGTNTLVYAIIVAVLLA